MVMRGFLIATAVAAFCVAAQVASALPGDPQATPISPENGNVSTLSNITFVCEAYDDESVYNISLFTTINGSFALSGTWRVLEPLPDVNTTLSCTFDNSYACDGGELGASNSTHFSDGILSRAVVVNGSDVLTYDVGGNIEYERGTIDFWVRTDFDPNSPEQKYLFSVLGQDGRDEMTIASSSGNMIFTFTDDEGSPGVVEMNISGWMEGEWHHVAVMWDVENQLPHKPENFDLFIDGSDELASVTNDFAVLRSFRTGYIYLGSYGGAGQSNATIDFFRISKYPRTPEWVNQTYVQSLANHSHESANWTLVNITDEVYTWNCLSYDNESKHAWGLTNYSLGLDAYSFPELNGFARSPDSEDDIDPLTNISVVANVSDISNVSSVIFQWKEIGDWINVTMDLDNASGLYENATIVTDITGGVYYYRIWSNDSLGHSGYSGTYNLTAEYDYTWTAFPTDFGTIAGFIGSEGTIGNITINNTGDETLQFSADDDWPSPYTIEYNDSESPLFTVAPKLTAFVIVNATFEGECSERGLAINVTAAHPTETPSPGSIEISATLNSYTDGPFLSVSITASPGSASQGESDINISARVKNIGNDTAEGVWLNWSLPSGWTISSGSAESFAGNLSPQGINVSSVLVALDSSAEAGAAFLCVNASAGGGVNGSACTMIIVSCSGNDGVCGAGCTYSNDDDCDPPRGEGGSTTFIGVAGAIVREPEMRVSVPERADLAKGGVYEVAVNVTNVVEGTNLTGISLGIAGYHETLIKVLPRGPAQIEYGQTKTFILEISVPGYVEEKDFVVTAIASATGVYSGGSKKLEGTGIMIFAVHVIMENDTLIAIGNAELALDEMKSSGFNYETLSNMLEDAKRAYGGLDFDRAKELAQRVVELHQLADRIAGMIRGVENDVSVASSFGVNAQESRKMKDLAVSAFQRGDYKRAEERITAAATAYQLETKDVLPIMRFLYGYWHAALIAALSALAAAVWARRRMRTRSMKKRIGKIRMIKKTLKSRVAAIQEDYFARGRISKMEYGILRRSLVKRIAELGDEETGLATRMALSRGRDKKAALLRLKESAEMELRALQQEHFVEGKMGKGEFEELSKALEARIAGVEGSLRLQGEKGKHGAASVAAAAIILLLLPAFACALENATAEGAAAAIAAAMKAVDEMKAAGFATEYANHTLEEARLLYSRGDFAPAVAAARYVPVIRQKAGALDRMVDDAEARIHDLAGRGEDVSGADALFRQGAEEFRKENYEEAEALISGSMDMLDEMERSAALSKAGEWVLPERLLAAVYQNRAALSAAAAVILLASAAIYAKLKRARKSRRIRDLRKEIDGAKESMKDLQGGYFSRGKISRKNYDARMLEHKKRLADAMEALQSEDARQDKS